MLTLDILAQVDSAIWLIDALEIFLRVQVGFRYFEDYTLLFGKEVVSL